jgi:hypothetical protein
MNKIILAVVLLALSSCAVNKNLEPTSGSKADGIIVMTYSLNNYQSPVLDWDIAKQEAQRRCQAWGYKDADKFAGVTKKCDSYSYFGCTSRLIDVKYQCTDK